MGVRFVESICNVALGIHIDANKDPLALVGGLDRERFLGHRTILFLVGLDGSKALRRD
jgi:hypothetical protein